MTLKSGTGQACAACKYQRRRCTSECVLAPYFPAEDPKTFLNVHRLFGVKHVQNIIKETPLHLRADAMNSIKYHADMREKHPIEGCLHDIRQLCFCIERAHKDLSVVMQQLDFFRQQQNHQQHHHHHQLQDQLGFHGNGSVFPLQLGMNNALGRSNVVALSFVQQEHNNLDSPGVAPEAFLNNGNPNVIEAVENNENGAFEYGGMHAFLDEGQHFLSSNEPYE